MREALKPSNEQYQTMWHARKGFVRTSIDTQTPIIIGVCPQADDLYNVYPSKLTKIMYKYLKIPVFFATGVGPTPIPKPVKLVHHLSKPIKPPRMTTDPEKVETQVDRFHKKILAEYEKMMDVAMDKNLLNKA